MLFSWCRQSPMYIEWIERRRVSCIHYTIWIVTATPTLFVQGVVDQWDWPVANVMGTSLFVSDHIYTRQFDEECIGQQKVKRIQQVLNDDKLDCSIEVAYGNLPVDKPMM